MPRLKLTESQQRVRSFQAVVAKQLTYYGYSKDQLAESMQMGRTSLWAKLKNPENFRVRELRRLCNILSIPSEDVNFLS